MNVRRLNRAASRASYLLLSARHYLQPSRFFCPSCGNARARVVDRKYVVTTLRECTKCHLLFRCPTTSEDEAAAFYQNEYQQGPTTDLPAPGELAEKMRNEFRGTRNDHSKYIVLLEAFGARPGSRVFDYGCSWGYGAWQLAAAGFDVTGYEISRPRARFAADHLGVRLATVHEQVDESYDFFFSAHVIEHVPSPRRMLEMGLRLLKPGGCFVAITPNGSQAYRMRAGRPWSTLWGQVHPQLISERWILSATEGPCFVSSFPVDLASCAAWKTGRCISGDIDGWELCFAVRKN